MLGRASLPDGLCPESTRHRKVAVTSGSKQDRCGRILPLRQLPLTLSDQGWFLILFCPSPWSLSEPQRLVKPSYCDRPHITKQFSRDKKETLGFSLVLLTITFQRRPASAGEPRAVWRRPSSGPKTPSSSDCCPAAISRCSL